MGSVVNMGSAPVTAGVAARSTGRAGPQTEVQTLNPPLFHRDACTRRFFASSLPNLPIRTAR
jgi:hypothetical protein